LFRKKTNWGTSAGVGEKGDLVFLKRKKNKENRPGLDKVSHPIRKRDRVAPLQVARKFFVFIVPISKNVKQTGGEDIISLQGKERCHQSKKGSIVVRQREEDANDEGSVSKKETVKGE